MFRDNYIFTSESVSEGHPDKVSDRISDEIVDLYLREMPEARVAAETLVQQIKSLLLVRCVVLNHYKIKQLMLLVRLLKILAMSKMVFIMKQLILNVLHEQLQILRLKIVQMIKMKVLATKVLCLVWLLLKQMNMACTIMEIFS